MFLRNVGLNLNKKRCKIQGMTAWKFNMNFFLSPGFFVLGFGRGFSRGGSNYGGCINIASNNTGITSLYIYA